MFLATRHMHLEQTWFSAVIKIKTFKHAGSIDNRVHSTIYAGSHNKKIDVVFTDTRQKQLTTVCRVVIYP